MDVSEFLINVGSPKRVVNELRRFIEQPGVKKAIEENNFNQIARFINHYDTDKLGVEGNNFYPIGHQAGGLLWAILRDSSDIDIIDELGYIPVDYYAYNNIDGLVELKDKNISYIGDCAFYKSNLKSISLPNTLEAIYTRAFCDLQSVRLLILFYGTKKEWRSISKDPTIFKDAFSDSYDRTIRCNDGDIER